MTDDGAKGVSLRYAGFWARFAATIIDYAWLYTIVYGILFYGIASGKFSKGESAFLVFDVIVEWTLPMVVVLVFWIAKSATPGKMALHIKIVNAKTGEKATPLRLVIRYLGYFLSIVPLFLGIIWVAWDQRKQGWHDKIAGTVVVHLRQ